VPQNEAHATFAPKLTREIAHIDWTMPAIHIVRQTLALDPRPGAWTTLDGHEVKLFEGHPTPGSGNAGEVLQADSRLLIAGGDGAVVVEEVQPAGKERMTAVDWIHGRGIRVGQRFA
jgi:methionyl-tRNA formyltransferase